MKNKLGLEEVSSGRLVAEFPVSQAERERADKPGGRRESAAPKIVVYPPMEELTSSSARGSSLLRLLGRHLSRRAADDDSFGNCSSSSDSVESESSCSSLRRDRSVSDSGSDDSERRRRPRSTVSLRRVFQSLNLGRSQSCSSTERARQPKKNPQPKRILRPPVTYTYVRGLSGLPTQRVPRNLAYCTSSGLHR
ncbi:hypothetical protein EVAR_28357_1 [Eumeta japonica]|uniref:DUF4797 domain-containing protein n=1 Tax=Eumeta variegata TaxID=151549 RepID=A0A4C1VA46_EUMVA|nr:hypothetical protein EVAR_28357_1 [Eumeta japonica]